LNPEESHIVPDLSPARTRSSWIRWAVVLVIAAIGLWFVRQFHVQSLLQKLLDRVASFGVWAPVLFVTLYVLATVLLIPGSVLTLGAGAVFGLGWGFVWVTLGANLGAQAAFLIGRFVARDWVSRKIADHAGFAAIDRVVGDEGWKIVGLTRLSPVFPFTFLNYAFGLTGVSLRHYAAATFIGMIPGTILYVYLGALANAGIKNKDRTPAQWAMLIVGLLAAVIVTAYITRIAKREMARKMESTSKN
jgi:uncharacterized membrane protein YdjX (TVP38/TMEM64 family)